MIDACARALFGSGQLFAESAQHPALPIISRAITHVDMAGYARDHVRDLPARPNYALEGTK